MYIRKKKNKSGSSSVFIVDQSRGEYRVVKRFGVGRTEEELELLEQRANQYLLEIKGLAQSLFEEKQDVPVGNYVANLSNEQLQLIGPELVYGRLYDKIGFGRLQNEMFRHLVVAHLFLPGSKVNVIDYLQRFIGKNHGVLSIYRFLDQLCFGKTEKNTATGKDMKRETEKITSKHTRKVLDAQMKPVLYHLLPLQFEAGEKKERKETAIPKKNKHQIPPLYLCLLTATNGFPVGYELFEENALHDNSFIHIIQQMNNRFDLSRPIVIADATLLSESCINTLEKEHYEYVLNADLKNETDDVQHKILNITLKEGDMTEIKRDDERRLIVSKSSELAAMDRLKRERGLKRLQQKIKSGRLSYENINNRGFNKYLKLKGKTKIVIDTEKCKTDAARDGITSYITNSTLRPEDIIANYNHYGLLKQAFRMNKADLLFRPVYHGLRNRIEALTCIFFTAYTIMLELDRQLKASGSTIQWKQAQEIIHTLYRMARSQETKKHFRKSEKQLAELCLIVENL